MAVEYLHNWIQNLEFISIAYFAEKHPGDQNRTSLMKFTTTDCSNLHYYCLIVSFSIEIYPYSGVNLLSV